MSTHTVEKTGPARVASRRAVVRGAAWTGAAVTIVVATPNIAAASHGEPHGTVSTLSIDRSINDANVHLVTWVIRVTNTGTAPISSLQATFDGVAGTTRLTITSSGGDWTGTGINTRTYGGVIPVGSSLDITVVFERSKNGTGVATASFLTGATAVGGPLGAIYS